MPCRKEFPLLAQIDAKPNVAVLGVVYKDTVANAKAFMASHGGTWPGLKDDGRIAKAYRVGPGVPATIVISPTGKVTVRQLGEIRAITDVIAGEASVTTALRIGDRSLHRRSVAASFCEGFRTYLWRNPSQNG